MRQGLYGCALTMGILFLGATAAQCIELPDGPNRDVVSRECQACHDLDMVAATTGTRDQWNNVLDEMTSYGMRISPEERAKILDYLVSSLAPKGSPAK
jgi:hypothetical protein